MAKVKLATPVKLRFLRSEVAFKNAVKFFTYGKKLWPILIKAITCRQANFTLIEMKNFTLKEFHFAERTTSL